MEVIVTHIRTLLLVLICGFIATPLAHADETVCNGKVTVLAADIAAADAVILDQSSNKKQGRADFEAIWPWPSTTCSSLMIFKMGRDRAGAEMASIIYAQYKSDAWKEAKHHLVPVNSKGEFEVKGISNCDWNTLRFVPEAGEFRAYCTARATVMLKNKKG